MINFVQNSVASHSFAEMLSKLAAGPFPIEVSHGLFVDVAAIFQKKVDLNSKFVGMTYDNVKVIGQRFSARVPLLRPAATSRPPKPQLGSKIECRDISFKEILIDPLLVIVCTRLSTVDTDKGRWVRDSLVGFGLILRI